MLYRKKFNRAVNHKAVFKYIHTCILAYVSTYRHPHVRIYTYIHAYIHTYLQTYTHYIHKYSYVNTHIITNRYELDVPEIEFRCRYNFPHPSRPALGRTQPHVQYSPCHYCGQSGRGVALTTHPYLVSR